eukprot:gnl/TRDRNA2_/TRDRNA2_176973_c0_seq6.p1 gnl/TRDRNA2_/TRDRNA2_176973_c0~~gnl/TRDRNA2_/TRDRNA2_176973_c0_seq6.p1  ORF type:complete len:533 (-),score=59.67 gnl/TRDRNA2_/TRDRNA2_176973_c0_seq6:79-1497(-)
MCVAEKARLHSDLTDEVALLQTRKSEQFVARPQGTWEYQFTSRFSPYPEKTAAFISRLTGAIPMESRSEWIRNDFSASAQVRALKFKTGTSEHHIYLEYDPSLPGAEQVADAMKKIDSVHTMASKDWDQWLDWHIAFEVSPDAAAAIATRALQDNIPIRSAVESFFVAGPGIVLQFQRGQYSHHDEAWRIVPGFKHIADWEFCKKTTDEKEGKLKAKRIRPSTLLDSKPLDDLVMKVHHIAIPTKNIPNAMAFFSGLGIDSSTKVRDSNSESNQCAELWWVRIGDRRLQYHFVNQYKKRDGGITVSSLEAMAEQLHGNKTSWRNAYSSYRTGLLYRGRLKDLEKVLIAGNMAYHIDAQQAPPKLYVPFSSGLGPMIEVTSLQDLQTVDGQKKMRNVGEERKLSNNDGFHHMSITYAVSRLHMSHQDVLLEEELEDGFEEFRWSDNDTKISSADGSRMSGLLYSQVAPRRGSG